MSAEYGATRVNQVQDIMAPGQVAMCIDARLWQKKWQQSPRPKQNCTERET